MLRMQYRFSGVKGHMDIITHSFDENKKCKTCGYQLSWWENFVFGLIKVKAINCREEHQARIERNI